MTLQRPMFPPRENNVIQFCAASANLKRPASDPEIGGYDDYLHKQKLKREAKLLEIETAPETLTETCKNARLRLARREAFWKAKQETNYWRARLDWEDALSLAQRHGIADSNTFYAEINWEARPLLIDLWRAALVKQLLTPAHRADEVAWKRVQLKHGQYKRIGVASEQIERAIAADVQWLEDHPVRAAKKSN